MCCKLCVWYVGDTEGVTQENNPFEVDMARLVKASDIDVFLSDAAWAICSTYHIVLKASPGAATFGWDMLFDILLLADWKKIGEHRQQLPDLNTARENKGSIDYDYKVGQKIHVRNNGLLCKAEFRYLKDPWPLQKSIQIEQSWFNTETI